MSFPPTLTTRTLKGKFVTYPDGAGATGTVRVILADFMRSLVDDAFVEPFDQTLTLNSEGEFSIVLPATNDPQWTPSHYRVLVTTGTGRILRARIHVPYDSTDDLDLSDLVNVPTPVPVAQPYLLVSAKGTPNGVATLDSTGKVPSSQLPASSGGSGPVSWDDVEDKPNVFPPAAHNQAMSTIVGLEAALAGKANVGEGGGGGGDGLDLFGPLFNVEDYGAVGDGTTDDYTAFAAAWTAMLASPLGGRVFLPRAVEYRIDASVSGRMTPDSNGAYALFKLPYVVPNAANPKRRYGIVGVGSPYVPREFPFAGGGPAQTMTSSVMKVTYSTPFTWSNTNGLPSVVGAPDADKGSVVSGQFWFTNLHFTVDNVTMRQPNNPSMACLNLETVSTAELGEVAFDVDVPLDNVAEPTRPTGVAVLLPRVQNNVTAVIDRILVQGYYAGIPWVEHVDIRSAIALRCRVAFHFRRNGYHFGHVSMMTIEQCPFGLAGYDPAGVAPNLGVVPIPANCVVKIDFLNFEDTSYGGEVPWMYTPSNGAHVYDPANRLYGQATAARNDVDDNGDTDTMWVDGGTHFSIFGLMQWSASGSTRINASANAPENPASSPPNAPTIGTASAGNTNASVSFTAASTGEAATSYTATSTPGGLTGTATSSPITVSGLTNGTAYTFKVKANNGAGSSAESSASNSVTPSGGSSGTTLASDDFNRADTAAGTLGTALVGGTWALPDSGLRILSNSVQHVSSGGGSYHVATLNTGSGDGTVSAVFTPPAGGSDFGLILRYGDFANYTMVDFSGGGTSWVSRTFEKVGGGSFAGVTSLVNLTGITPGSPVTFKAVMNGANIEVFYNTGSGDTSLGSFTSNVALRTNVNHGIMFESGQSLGSIDDFLVVS